MKRLLLVVIFTLITTRGYADTSNTVTWEVTGLRIGGDLVDFIEFDVQVGITYVLLFGAVDFNDGFSTPSIGSCFFPSNALLFCNLTVGDESVVLTIQEDLDGSIETVDSFGSVIDDGFLLLAGFD